MPTRTVSNWMKSSHGSVPVVHSEITNTLGKKRTPSNKVNEVDLENLDNYLESLTTLPSHYCRAKDDRRFLEPGRTMIKIFEEYQKFASTNAKRAISYPIFSNHFHNKRLSVYIPKKDQCDKCTALKHKNISEDVYVAHIKKKRSAQEAKAADKVTAQNNVEISCWTMDAQAVLLCPRTPASSMYYKSKLQIHNFTFFGLVTKSGHSYVWDETEGGLDANIFAYLQYNHFKTYFEANTQVKTLIIWSDGCGYQNKNCILSNAYLHLAKDIGITIIQKFLTVGHTQMECDSMHSLIERSLPSEIYTPRDYIVTMQRKTPEPYVVHHLSHKFFKTGFENSYHNTIRPGSNKQGQPTVNELSALKYQKSGIEYKLDL